MTAPQDVTGLVGRSAAAYARGVPEHPADDGFFGPRSVTWRSAGDLSAPVAGLRALMLQALHPLAMAGVDQHSDWRADPVGRLAATSGYLATVSFGEKGVAERVAERVRKIHTTVSGTDTVTGKPYAASDPALLLWVHAALVDSNLTARSLFGAALPTADADRYVAEMVVSAELVGVPRDVVPATLAQLAGYIDSVRPELRCTPAATESMAFLLDPAGLDEDVAEIWQDIRDGAVGSLPEWAARMYGYDRPALTRERCTQIRQALGVL
ncbi:MAG TPA: oxygenase MpaB family protein, partial [Streptosporangiaceae bacterium]|nr:oxygenase MpaB family protein [Streptosporangiaceae bacterium]